MDNIWFSVEDRPLQVGEEVIGYNPKWIDEDFNPNGTRIGFLMDGIGFCSAKWNNEDDCYDTLYEEGDDYYKGNSFVIEQEKENALPNMPTHYMFIPKHP